MERLESKEASGREPGRSAQDEADQLGLTVRAGLDEDPLELALAPEEEEDWGE